MANISFRALAPVNRKEDARGRFSRRLRVALAFGCAVALLASCGSSGKDTLDTLGPVGTDVEPTAAGGAGPIAVAAVSSEAALAAQRLDVGNTLKSFVVTFTGPTQAAGEAKADSSGAICSKPGTVPEGGQFELTYASAKDAKVSAFSANTQGTYEGPGNYSANFTWTDPGGAKTGTGTMFVYGDEESGEFAVEGANPLTGTWQCVFKN